jgi:hypothetical protein
MMISTIRCLSPVVNDRSKPPLHSRDSTLMAQAAPVNAAGLATEQSPVHFDRISEPRRQWLETLASILIHKHGRLRTNRMAPVRIKPLAKCRTLS